MANQFAGQTALVTAAGKGIGRAVARQLAANGANVVLVDDVEEDLQKTVRELKQLGVKTPVAFQAVMTNPSAIEDIFSTIKHTFRSLNVAVLHTGDPPTGTFTQLDNSMWEQCFQTQLMSTIVTARAAYPLFVEAGGGRLLTIASSSLKATVPGFMLSNTIRAAVGELMKSLSVEWAKDGILVNTVLPSRSAIDRTSWEEFAKAILYFISEDNTYMSGSTVHVDGRTFSCNTTI